MPDLMKHLHYRVIDVSTIKRTSLLAGTRLLVIMRQLRPETIVLLEISKTRLMNSNTTVAQFFVPDVPDAITAARIARDVEAERQTLEKA